MAEDVRVVVSGIGKLQSALKKVDDETPAKLKEGFKRIAEMVASSARSKVPRRTGKAAASIKARASTRGGSIAFGGSAAPHYPWLDFGGSTKRRVGGVRREWKGNPVGEGRYIYPSIREKNREIREMTDDMLASVIKGAGFDTRD